MKDYRRAYPEFALCGLNCGLCPRYHADGPSRCPGCGGPGFHLKHPSCAVVTCARNHGAVEFCYECAEFPCPRFSGPNTRDSFITYRNVPADLVRAKRSGLKAYRKELDRKIEILRLLLKNADDGRHKGFYCLAVNLLGLPVLERMVKTIEAQMKARGPVDAKAAVEILEAAAKKKGIELKLRKG